MVVDLGRFHVDAELGVDQPHPLAGRDGIQAHIAELFARADLVLAGCAILDAIRRAFPCPRLRVADRGLREGMLVGMMRADGALIAS